MRCDKKPWVRSSDPTARIDWSRVDEGRRHNARSLKARATLSYYWLKKRFRDALLSRELKNKLSRSTQNEEKNI
jgi:hypothetical protein